MLLESVKQLLPREYELVNRHKETIKKHKPGTILSTSDFGLEPDDDLGSVMYFVKSVKSLALVYELENVIITEQTVQRLIKEGDKAWKKVILKFRVKDPGYD